MKRSAQPYVYAREKRLERGNEKLRKESNVLHEVQRVLRVIYIVAVTISVKKIPDANLKGLTDSCR